MFRNALLVYPTSFEIVAILFVQLINLRMIDIMLRLLWSLRKL